MAAMYDKARCFGFDNEEIDFKSICSTKTSGVVVIPPSKGKTWIRGLYDTPLPDFSGKIFDYFFDNWNNRRYVYTFKADPELKIKKHDIIDDIDEDSGFDKVDISENDVLMIKNLIDCLSYNRSHDFTSWINVCWCLKNIYAQYDDPDELIKKLWIEFSSKCKNKFNYDQSTDKWYRTIPRKSGLKLGTLKFWAHEDDPDKYNEISMSENEISEIVKKQIKDLVKIAFYHTPTKISSIIIKEYDEKKMIFVNIDDTYCNLCDDIHDESSNFIIMNDQYAYEKCKISDKKSDQIKISGDLKTSLNEIMSIDISPEKAIVDFVNECASENDEIKEMNIARVEKKEENIMGSHFPIPHKVYCPLHKEIHETPCNYMYVNHPRALMAVACNQSPFGQLYPQQGIPVPQRTMNIIMGNTINNNTTINNNYIGDSEEIYSDLFNETYEIFDDPELNKLINISFKGYASDIANLFYYLAGNKFGVSGKKEDIWWAWDSLEQRWIESKTKAHRFCDSDISDKYDKVIEWFRENTENDDLRKKRIFKIESILKRLKDKDQNSILSQAAIIYKDEIRYFEESLDDNKNILNFQGDVYDFDTLQFRKVSPDDRVTKSVGYSIPEIDIHQRNKIMDFLHSIMANDSQVNYLLIWLASCLDGYNNDENFHVLKGTGRNGKGVLRDLIAETFGSCSRGYYGTIVSSMLTKERPSSDKPVADLLHIKGKRFLAANEPEKSAKINDGFMKFLTGNDPINGRWLNSNEEITFWPQHSLCILCNDVPKLDANDEAVWDRNRIIDFPYKFVANPVGDKQKKINKNLKTEMKGLGPQFMLILLEYYVKYKKEGLEPTEDVMKATDNVRDENDSYKEFIEDKLESTDNDFDRISQPEINKVCNKWMSENKKDEKFKKSSIKESMEKIYGKLINNLWITNKKEAGWSYVKWKNYL